MKRSGPLKRKTPLKSKKGLDRGKPLKRGDSQLKRTELKRGDKPMAQRSEKTAKRYREERVPFVKNILAERPKCQACPVWAAFDNRASFIHRPSVDVHEILGRGRSGGVHGDAWLDPENVLAVCRPCHTRLTDEVADATALGLLKASTAETD